MSSIIDAERPSAPDFLTADGEMAERIRAHDWASTPLGPVGAWPQHLRTAVELMLSSPSPVSILWGPDRVQLYNDAYVPIAAERHPEAFGRAAADNWSDAYEDVLGPIFARVFAGEAVKLAEHVVPLRRLNGSVEERYFTGSFQPVRDETGQVAGIFHPLVEVTAEVRADAELRESEARQAFLLRFSDALRAETDPDAVAQLALRTLADRLRLDRCYIGVYRLEDDRADITHQVGNHRVPPVPDHVRLSDFPEALRIAFDRTLVIDDAAAAEGFSDADKHNLEGLGMRAIVAATLRKGEQVPLWAIVAVSAVPRAWTAGEIALIEEVAERTWAAVERARAEAALRESEARYRTLFEKVESGFCVVEVKLEEPGARIDYRVIEANPAFYRQTGFPEAILGCWLREAAPELEDHWYETYGRVARTGEPARFEQGSQMLGRWFDVNAFKVGEPDAHRVAILFTDITTRRTAELALQESEERLRLAVNNAEIGFWDVDVVHDVLIWPPRTKAMFGISPQVPVTMQDFYDGLHPDDREATGAAYAAAADPAARALYDVEYRTIGKEDGVVRWLAAKGRGLFDGPGPDARCLRVIGTVIDISARKAIEARLRELNETLERRVAEALAEKRLFADLVEGTDAFVQVVDPQLRWLAINKAAADEFERIFGVRPSVGQSMLDVLAHQPEHRDAVRAVWSRALEGEEFTEIGEFGDPGRDRRFYEMKYNALRDAQGERVGAYQFAYDVTQRIQEQHRLAEAEAARRESDALYRAYFENTAEALFVVNVLDDGGFTVEDLNPAHQAGIGLPLAEVKGKRVDAILPPETAAPVTEHYRRVIAEGGVYQYRESFELHGRKTHWDTVLVPVRGPDGRIVRLIGSSRDLTAQLAAEEQLRQSQKLEAMGQLTGGVAHDFNNLLTPIIGSLDMLIRKGIGSERERRLIDGALQSAERARTLVQRLLAFARRQPLQPEAVDLRAVVEGMAGLIGSTLGPTTDVRVELGPDLPPVTADPNQLEMALLNLAVNARDAMPGGGVLTIAARRRDAGPQHRAKLPRGDYVALSVADNGVGMDEATLARAVEPFFSTKGIGKGTGLGLSMVHGLVAQLGGGLTIDSAPGRGTIIELWLPISADPVKGANGAAAATEARRSRGTALLVDDEDLVRMTTADMLIDLGFEVIEAGSAEEALRLVEAGAAPDLLVTDHLMPGMSGADLARRLLAARPGLPVLIVSGYAEADGVAPDLPRLTKPFRNAELAAKIEEVARSGPG